MINKSVFAVHFQYIEESQYAEFDTYIYDVNDNQTTYRIFIATPKGTSSPKKEKFPVLYLLDGNKQFPIALKKAELKRKKLIIVGIGYQNDDPENISRMRTKDYTPYAVGDNDFKGGGGALNFYQFIISSLRPWINQNLSVDQNKQTLYGHSYGGLFTLFSLFHNNLSFQNYVVASPSLWWGYGIVVPNRSPLLSHCPEKIIMTIGEKEEHPDFNEIDEEFKRFLLKYKDVITARELNNLFKKQFDNIQYHMFKNKSHGDSIEDAIATAIDSI